jgi:hypothetical protein
MAVVLFSAPVASLAVADIQQAAFFMTVVAPHTQSPLKNALFYETR